MSKSRPNFVRPPDFDVFDQNIGSGNHGFEPRQILGVFQINRNACFPLICAVEIGSRFVSAALDKEGTPYAGVISFGAFDLDHIGPQICQSLADPRPCEDAGQFDDFQALQSYVYFNPMFLYCFETHPCFCSEHSSALI
jgi:hypothetical protein